MKAFRIATLALAMLAIAEVPAAHIRQVGQSLLGLLARSEAVIIAEAIEGTRDDRDASGRLRRSETSFRVIRTLAGGTAVGEFLRLEAAPPALRYAGGQIAIVLIARSDGAEGGRWRAVQGTGAGLVLASSAEKEVERIVGELWDAVHRHVAPGELASALIRLLDAEPRKLAMMAAFDLAELAHEGRLPSSAVQSLRERLADPALPPELRAIVEHALAHPPTAQSSPEEAPDANRTTSPALADQSP